MLTLLPTAVFKLERTVKIRQNVVHSDITSTPLRENVVCKSYSWQDSNLSRHSSYIQLVEHVPWCLLNFLRFLSVGPAK